MRRSKLRPPRHVLVLFIAVAAVSVSALVWLSWRLLRQDRALENQRIQERLERAADLIVTSLDLGLSEIENRLSILSDPGDHALSVAVGSGGVKGRAFDSLLARGNKPRASTAELNPRAKPGAPAAVTGRTQNDYIAGCGALSEPDQRYRHAAEAEKVLDLELCPEDCVTKPFSSRELRARIKTALRRTEYRFDS